MKQYFFMAIIAMLLFACNKSSENFSKDIQLPEPVSNNTSTDQDKNKSEEGAFNITDTISQNITSNKKNPAITNTDNPDWDKKIIKTANIQLQLDDYKKFNTSIHNSIKQFGAYIAAEKQQETSYRIENAVTIKVPVAQFEDLVNSLNGDGIKVMEKNISSDDVTGQVIDTKARTQAKMAVRDKYLELLKQAKNMNEILQVQNEVNNIQEDIEAANGRINYLQQSSAYSTVELNYYQYINGSTSNDEKPGFFKQLTGAFTDGLSWLGQLIIFLISIWPLLLGIFIFWFLVKSFRLKKV